MIPFGWYCHLTFKQHNMSYTLIDRTSGIGYKITDIPGIAGIVNISKHTITNWFRNNNQYHESGCYCIAKHTVTIKSNRGYKPGK